MKYALSDFTLGIELIMREMTNEKRKVRTVTVFCPPLSNVKQRIRVTRRAKNELLVTYGKPNYSEREFLKLCKKAKTNPRKFRFEYFPKKKK